MPSVELPQGTIDVVERGDGPPLLFLHGVFAGASLWDDVIARLAGDHRCLAPTLPFGAHRSPMRPGADLSPPGVARLVVDLLDALELREASLIANDTGGAIAQLVVARAPERVSRLVLPSCDAYEHFPPTLIRPLKWFAALPAVAGPALHVLRFPPASRAFLATVAKRGDALRAQAWLEALLADAGVRRDVLAFLRTADPAHTLGAVPALRAFDRPALVLWAADDVFFPRRDGERLAADLPRARLEVIPDSRTFLPMDQPEATANAIAAFLAQTAAAQPAQG